MFNSASDYMIFSSCVLLICAVISIAINTTSVRKMLKVDEKLLDKISFYKSKWNKENYWRYVVPLLIYIIASCIAAIFSQVPMLIILSIFLVLIYTEVNRLMMKYVEKNVLSNKEVSDEKDL